MVTVLVTPDYPLTLIYYPLAPTATPFLPISHP